MVALFKKRCWLCSEKIDKGKEIFENGKAFCSEAHSKDYEKKCNSQKSGGCCGNC